MAARALIRRPTVDADSVPVVTRKYTDRVALAEWYHDGTLLNKLAQEHLEAFAQLMPDHPLQVHRKLTWGSACTGSAGDAMVAHALVDVWSPALEVDYLFSCESNKFKQRWVSAVHRMSEGGPQPRGACLFPDIMGIGGTSCWCLEHNRTCAVPKVDVFICCTSCKDLSRINNSTKGAATGLPPVLSRTESKGGSAQTFHGMIAYLEGHRPGLVFWENVDTADQESTGVTPCESNTDIVLAEFGSRGYECQKLVVSSAQFGVPQARRRVFVIGILTVANPRLTFQSRTIDDVFKSLRSLIKVCLRKPPCASKLILPDDHGSVAAELQRRQASGPKRNVYAMEVAMRKAAEHGINWAKMETPTHLKTSPWFSTLSAQQSDAAVFSLAAEPQPLLMRDVSQTPTRVRVSSRCSGLHLAPTMLPNQVVLVFHPDGRKPRLLLGEESLLFQGFPVSELPIDVFNGFRKLSTQTSRATWCRCQYCSHWSRPAWQWFHGAMRSQQATTRSRKQ